MDIKDFIIKFSEILDDSDVTILSPDTKFRELDEWSSLSALGLIALADEEYDVELRGDEIKNSETIKDIFDIIKGKI